jgi:hypothetical protein
MTWEARRLHHEADQCVAEHARPACPAKQSPLDATRFLEHHAPSPFGWPAVLAWAQEIREIAVHRGMSR